MIDQKDFKFLNGLGETSKLIRSIDWTKTPVGPVKQWPQSLKTTLSIILNSKFPMFLFWGPELICFYNDAYRPSLGNNGKHPKAMGQPAKECWPEIWEFIEPQIYQVLTGGEASWNEDLLLPIYRNGQMEDVYWTFSYSPVYDESGKPAGVFVTCTETTEKVKNLKKLQENKDELTFATNAAELGTWDLDPSTNRFIGNALLKEWFGLPPDAEIDLSAAINVIEETEREKVVSAITKALTPGSDGNYNIKYTLINPLTEKKRIVLAKGKALFDESGNAYRFSGILQDITNDLVIRERLINSEMNFRNLIIQAPVAMCVLRGTDYTVEVVNDRMLRLWGKTADDVLNKPIFLALPVLQDQKLEDRLLHVFKTGETSVANEIPINLNPDQGTKYVNSVYKALKDVDGEISGITIASIEVTEQVNARLKIEDAEERARLAAESTNIGTFDLDLNTYEVISSPRLHSIFDLKSSPTRIEYDAVFHPEDKRARQKALDEALITGKLFYVVRIIWRDKSVHWVRAEGKVYYDADKKPVRMLGTIMDITKEIESRAEQQKLITLVDNSVDLMSILTLSGTNSYINEAGMALLGFENKYQVLTTPIAELHTPEDFEHVRKEVLPTVMKEGRWSGKMTVRNIKTGEIFPVFNNCIRIDDPVSGVPIAVGAVMRDLRPEIAAKQALAESELMLRNITTAAPTALWMADENGLITYVNQTWVTWTGYPFKDQLGTGWLKAIHHEDIQRAGRKFIADLSTKMFYEVEFRINHTDGSIHWCVATGEPQYNNDGIFTGYIGACTDITEQKNLQLQKDNFIGIASHELKTPVTSIKAYTQVLEKILLKKGDSKEANMIAKMDGQINRLTSLIGDLLDVTKINSGKLQFNDREFDFNGMIKELIEDLQRTTEKHTLVEHSAQIGSVYADKERIGQVITNLITNAIKYSPHSDTINISSEVKDGKVNVCVQDFGIGIPKNKLEKVFEQFYRVSGDKQHTFPGLGLGLYISSEIIKREGGKIWVNSEEGEGSTFCFSLPVKTSSSN